MDFKKKEIIGMIHLSGPDVAQKALEEIRIYEEEGLSGIIVENYHGDIEDVIETLSLLKQHPTTLSVGINILPNEWSTVYEIANEFPFIEFMQLDYISGKYKNRPTFDEENFIKAWIKQENIKIYGGVWPKYYTPVEGSDLKNDIHDALCLCDGIVVTGSGTGQETPLEKIKEFREIMNGYGNKCKLRGNTVPLIVGAGLTTENVGYCLGIAQGGIVGSAFKPNGRTAQMVDRDLVQEFMDVVNKI
jgi:predicted TIM-barrel enzyme